MQTEIMRDHAPRVEAQSHIERKRAEALRWLQDNGKHVLQPSFRYSQQPVVLDAFKQGRTR